MNVLIVGGTGVISTAVVNEAVKRDIQVTCINRGNNHGVLPNPNVETLHFDIRDRKLARCMLENRYFDVIVDFICFTAEHVRNSLDLFCDKCKQYVFISTDSVYSLQKSGYYNENTPQPNPEWAYSYRKSECENIVKDFCKKNNINYTIVRPSITYGNTRIPYGFMPGYGYHYTLIKRIENDKPIVYWNDGKNVQTVIRVEDFAVGMVGLWGNPKAINEDFGICGELVSWSDILDAIEKCIGKKAIRINVPVEEIVTKLPSRRGEFLIDRAEDHIVDNSKLKAVVPDFKISLPIEAGIKKTLDYYVKNNNVLGIDYEYDGQADMLLRKHYIGKLHLVKYDSSINLYTKLQYYKGYYADNKIMTKSLWLVELPIRVMRMFSRVLHK